MLGIILEGFEGFGDESLRFQNIGPLKKLKIILVMPALKSLFL